MTEAQSGPTIDHAQNIGLTDKFDKYITPEERRILLAGPIPLVVNVIVEAAQELSQEDRQLIATRAGGLDTTGAVISEQVSNFIKAVSKTEVTALAPYAGAGDHDYLAIFCGVLAAVEDSADSAQMAHQLVYGLGAKAGRVLQHNPQPHPGFAAVNVLREKIATIGQLQTPAKIG